jgi:hypothetical protein
LKAKIILYLGARKRLKQDRQNMIRSPLPVGL